MSLDSNATVEMCFMETKSAVPSDVLITMDVYFGISHT